MSNTPLTDAEGFIQDGVHLVTANFARMLEKRLAESEKERMTLIMRAQEAESKLKENQ